MDGPTEVTLDAATNVDPGNAPVFDGSLETPSRTVVASTVDRKPLLRVSVPGNQTRVRIWTNHPMEPDKVVVGVG